MHRLVLALALIAAATPAMADSFANLKPQCIACHGDKGVSPTPETPSLGGQTEFYVLTQLVAFREGQRKSDIMNPMIKGMSDDDLRAAADFIKTLPLPAPPAEPVDPARMARGKEISEKNRCNICHGSDYSGQEQVPRIRNQREDYLLKALTDFKTDKRFGGRAEMNEVVYPLNGQQLADLAYYLAHIR